MAKINISVENPEDLIWDKEVELAKVKSELTRLNCKKETLEAELAQLKILKYIGLI